MQVLQAFSINNVVHTNSVKDISKNILACSFCQKLRRLLQIWANCISKPFVLQLYSNGATFLIWKVKYPKKNATKRKNLSAAPITSFLTSGKTTDIFSFRQFCVNWAQSPNILSLVSSLLLYVSEGKTSHYRTNIAALYDFDNWTTVL